MTSIKSIRKVKGFTLLEAIVALVILSTSGLAIYSWMATSLDSLHRVNNVVVLNKFSGNLDAYFRSVNLQSETKRTTKLDGYEVAWTATLVEPRRVGRHSTGVRSNFVIGLYNISAVVSKGKVEVGSYKTRIVGYRPVKGRSG